MSVYVDPAMDHGWRLGPSCHLFADTLEELHVFAARIGMKPHWFQDKPSLPHYDLTLTKRARAVNLGAIEMSRRDAVLKWREIRALRAPHLLEAP